MRAFVSRWKEGSTDRVVEEKVEGQPLCLDVETESDFDAGRSGLRFSDVGELHIGGKRANSNVLMPHSRRLIRFA